MPRNLHDEGRRAELHRRLDALRPDATPRWGRMSPDQMLWHLNSALAMAIGDLPAKPFHTAFRRTVIKAYALYGPWPKGRAPTARELNARANRFEFEDERARLHGRIDALGAKPITAEWPVHPAFGPMSGAAWSLLQSRHVDWHLTQFGA
jgi:hypothetical protein